MKSRTIITAVVISKYGASVQSNIVIPNNVYKIESILVNIEGSEDLHIETPIAEVSISLPSWGMVDVQRLSIYRADGGAKINKHPIHVHIKNEYVNSRASVIVNPFVYKTTASKKITIYLICTQK